MPNRGFRPKLVVNDVLPVIKNEMHGLLRDEKIDEFNAKKSKGEKVDLSDCNLRGLDLRGIDASGINFSGSYLRQADLRGLDLTTCNLEGASINQAVVSGTYFPANLAPEEINLSIQLGTRMRVKNPWKMKFGVVKK